MVLKICESCIRWRKKLITMQNCSVLLWFRRVCAKVLQWSEIRRASQVGQLRLWPARLNRSATSEFRRVLVAGSPLYRHPRRRRRNPPNAAAVAVRSCRAAVDRHDGKADQGRVPCLASNSQLPGGRRPTVVPATRHDDDDDDPRWRTAPEVPAKTQCRLFADFSRLRRSLGGVDGQIYGPPSR